MYKKGDKFVIEICDVIDYGIGCIKNYRIKHDYESITRIDLDKLDRYAPEEDFEKGYQKGLEAAWQTAKKIILDETSGGLQGRVVQNIFNKGSFGTLRSYTAAKAIAKIKAYEDKQQNGIKVGDEIEYTDNNDRMKGIVLQMFNKDDGCYKALNQYGWVQGIYDTDCYNIKKAGRNFAEVVELLEALNGNEEGNNDKTLQ